MYIKLKEMEQHTVFTDMLEERRKDCDILWVSRSMDPLLPHKLPADSKYTRSKIISAVLSDPRVKLAIHSIAASKDISVKDVEDNAYSMVNEMASKAHLATVRWLGIYFLINCIYLSVTFIYTIIYF